MSELESEGFGQFFGGFDIGWTIPLNASTAGVMLGIEIDDFMGRRVMKPLLGI